MRKMAEDNNLYFNLLTKSAMPHVILAVGKKKLVNFSKIQAYVISLNGPINPNTIQSRLKELEVASLLDTEQIPDRDREEYTYHAKPILEMIGERLAHLFDEGKEVYPISKEIVAQLNEYAKLEGVTWQELMPQAITDLLNKLKDKHPLKVGKI